jgi:hypothetical protein
MRRRERVSKMRELFEQLFQELPWPGAYEVNGQNWEQLKAEFPPAKTPDYVTSWMCFGLRIYVDESVPSDEIHAVSMVRDPETGDYKKQVSRIINIDKSYKPPEVAD